MPNSTVRRMHAGGRGGGFRRAGAKMAYHGPRTRTFAATSSARGEATSMDERWERAALAHQIDEAMGFARYEAGRRREGWLVNVQPTSIKDERVSGGGGRAAIDCYFIEDDGSTFKATLEYEPYFLIACRIGHEAEVEEWCKRFPAGGLVKTVRRVEKEDLKMPNHLMGYRRTFLELRFDNVQDLMATRRDIMPVAEKNKKRMDAMDIYAEVVSANANVDLFDADFNPADDNDDGALRRAETPRQHQASVADASDFIVDIREYDVPYHVRVMIDRDIRVGSWYWVEAKHGVTTVVRNEEHLTIADPVVMAFDIETTKLPLKFPDAAADQVMMISYMIDGQGFLITNREIVSEDIADFEYSPRPEYPGPFMIFNEPDERALLERFFSHIKEARPIVIATYNGDFFDWPFIETRASVNGIDIYREIGWRRDGGGGGGRGGGGGGGDEQFRSNYGVHMDCFHWVNRDSYLPQGSRGLKAVTVAKLGYDPDELDPELMTPYASERPQTLAEYSVSDAVATYYLYMKYVHPFIFSLCTILPLSGDETLRKGTGTLCEMLLMVQAYQKGIVLPNKHVSPREAFWDGHLLESETYVGGHVESIEAGVFRSDIPVSFAVDPEAIAELTADLDAALTFSITVEEKKSVEDVTNYDDVRQDIASRLARLADTPNRSERPLIYHLDVASMYPNIMTTNRLQPDSMISEADCAACDFNRPGKTCDRRLPWAWRGEYLPAKRDEYNMIRHALESERFPAKANAKSAAAAAGAAPGGGTRSFQDLSPDEQAALIRKRLQLYSQKVYHRIHESTTQVREAIICQRENPFYINTVRDFRDRRYDYKGKAKIWKGKVDTLRRSGAMPAEVDTARKMIILYDSLQLAHKVILNSFYGYVMRKGSRWYSMEMAGVTCLTGATIIQLAKELVDRLGRPLELDTDGIWCMLPGSFPENFAFRLKNGKSLTISYPCVMLNHLVHARFTNHQYQTLADPTTPHHYDTHSDNSIFFEVDGPYRAMILPTSKEEDKNLKKRYAVFNHDGSLAELKGFEVKRRGELKLIKIFQQQIFRFFLEGSTLAECYSAVAKVANRWLDVLHSRGATLADEELMDLISENRSMSKTLEEYGAQKSTSITTARRLADFLGEQMVKDKGLNCKFIICARPRNAPVTDRAVPVAIFSADEATKRHYLKRWLREEPPDTDPRALLDWDYYLERLGSVIQKLITIPAALQKVRNPVPRVAHPDWLQRRIAVKDDKMKQRTLDGLLKPINANAKMGDRDSVPSQLAADMEDFGAASLGVRSTVRDASTRDAAGAHREPEGVSNLAPAEKRKNSPEPAGAAADGVVDGLLDASPSPSDDYLSFLAYQKRKWKLQKQARARRRHLFGHRRAAIGHDARAAGGLQNTIRQKFHNQAEAMLRGTWQLLCLRASDVPGIVTAFVLIDSRMHALRLKVARQFFVNLWTDELPPLNIPGCEVEKVYHTLPNGHASVHLFRIAVPERVFVSESDQFDELFAHPSVEGIYEVHMPLALRAVLRLGNACTVDENQAGVLGQGVDEGFELSGLKRPARSRPYLEGETSRMSYVYLSHISAGERQIFGLFSSVAAAAHVVVLQRGKDGGKEDMPNMSKLYADLLRRRRAEETENGKALDCCFTYQDSLGFKVTHVSTRRKAMLEISDLVKKVVKEAKRRRTPAEEAVAGDDSARPVIAVVQSSQQHLLVPEIAALADLPVMGLRYDQDDSALPPLGWQAVAARRLVHHFLSLGPWVEHKAALARFGDVPLCNLERDDPRFLIDIEYARRLQANKVVLWWSPGPLPDHAGHEKDDPAGPSLNRVSMPSVNYPGTFASVCIDLSVRNLAINTILTFSLINETGTIGGGGGSGDMDGAGGDGDDEGEIISSERAFTSEGVQVLREMVKAWWVEACKGSQMADVLVQHLVRWVESPASYLYDSALHQYVQMMSRKALLQLMADFRRVGSRVVFASADRLLLQTTKGEVANAYAYAQYLLRSIKSQPLFHFIDLEIREYWDYLVWYDQFNFGGMACKEIAERDGEAQQVRTTMHWQMARFLPVRLQAFFHDWVVEFVHLMHGHKRPPTGEDPTSTPGPTQLSRMADGGSQAPGQVILSDAFETPLRRAVLALVDTQKRELLHPELAGDYSYPQLPGSHLGGFSASAATAANPVLELVKMLMQVLSLDRNIVLEARLLRKELLALFDIREFSRDGTFRNPSESLGVAQVSCENCALARDLDLCRDEEVFLTIPDEEHGGSAAAAPRRVWRCPSCSAEYNRFDLEERLVGEVEAMFAAWTTQDLKCTKCAALRVNDLMEHCPCSGDWAETVKREDATRRLRVYRNVAAFYELRLLKNTVEGFLELL